MSTTQRMRDAWAGTACKGPIIRRYFIGRKAVEVAAKANEATSALACVIQAHKYPVREIGGYVCRKITGGKGLSLHAHATAIDINPRQNPYGPKLITDMPPAMIADVTRVRTKTGKQVWRWGGDWDGHPDTGERVYDAMHFEIVCTPGELAAGIDWFTVKMPAMRPAQPDTWPTLQIGDRGPTVYQLQEMLGLDADGRFGTRTEARVKAFQTQHKLATDGVVGLATWTVLLMGVKEAPPELRHTAEEAAPVAKVLQEPEPVAVIEPQDDDAGPVEVLVDDVPPVDTTPQETTRPAPAVRARPPMSGLPGVKQDAPAPAPESEPEAPRVIHITKEVAVPEMPPKALWQTKTFWSNAIPLLAVALADAANIPGVREYAPELLAAVNILNIVLRLLTKAPATLTGNQA